MILCSHLGRPKGGPDMAFTLRPVADYLGKLMGKPVKFAEDCVGPKAEEAAKALKPGEVLVLENTRFHPEEEKNDMEMAKQLASLADIYVNDAFGSAHRAHSSTEGVAHFLPAVAGFLMEEEIKYLGQAIEDPKRPFVAILGGAKISDKIGVIKNLLTKADVILIGGGMANTFFKAPRAGRWPIRWSRTKRWTLPASCWQAAATNCVCRWTWSSAINSMPKRR